MASEGGAYFKFESFDLSLYLNFEYSDYFKYQSKGFTGMSQRGTPASGSGDISHPSPEKRYKLRESAGKVPSRYRDYIEESQYQPMDTSVSYGPPPIQRTVQPARFVVI